MLNLKIKDSDFWVLKVEKSKKWILHSLRECENVYVQNNKHGQNRHFRGLLKASFGDQNFHHKFVIARHYDVQKQILFKIYKRHKK